MTFVGLYYAREWSDTLTWWFKIIYEPLCFETKKNTMFQEHFFNISRDIAYSVISTF